jgi:hypothetical protein
MLSAIPTFQMATWNYKKVATAIEVVRQYDPVYKHTPS